MNDELIDLLAAALRDSHIYDPGLIRDSDIYDAGPDEGVRWAPASLRPEVAKHYARAIINALEAKNLKIVEGRGPSASAAKKREGSQ